MSDIKDRWTIYRLKKANAANRKKLDKMGALKNQRKPQSFVIDELNERFSEEKAITDSRRKTNVSSKEDANNKKLKKTDDRLEDAVRSMRNTIRRNKRSVKHVWKGDDIKKYAKDIFKEYYEDYEKLTMGNLEEFLKICKKYDVIPADKFDYEIYRRMFETIRISSKEKKLTPERLKMFSRKIFNDLKQAGEASDGTINSVMHPCMAFMQPLTKVALFLPQLMKKMSGDDYSLFQIRKIKNEMENTVFKKFGIVELTKLRSEEYRNACKEKLAQFSEEISSLIIDLNEGQRKLGSSDSDYRFGELMKQTVN